MGIKQIVKVMFLFLCVIMALLCHHQSEVQAAQKPSPVACWSSINKVQGCVDAVKAATKGDYKGLSKDCCLAIYGLIDDCFPIVFSGKPDIAVLVKDACAVN
ncbi:ECA1 gametogenesis related family protein [Arabidopsis thaliana]|uniref:ECA1 gametogenesis related family protein n=1 Tax=Arabidopsis thaliana TaxID=3702 RepID=A8MS22_ARATH|nr:ECA1 gametogenesis related family protein [Arabidopsis thaliana]AED92101.1 ECA1 gametogenesis related family protein [Arabidopsis thaliana]|eukprot:NP_001078586.1 ECA1 gametogenesis related family protein [Arabidopsis thaliana]